jgi:hypothetical protein
MKKVAIMQPYFLPYIGYFQLLNAVDEFVVYDNIEFSKKGWINRNRILVNGKDDYITLPLKKDSDFLHIRERRLADTWPQDGKKMLNRLTESYRKAPQFEVVFPIAQKIILSAEANLFLFLHHSLQTISEYLGIATPIVVSSTIQADHSLKAEHRVVSICKAEQATTYINPIGGVELYDRKFFSDNGLELRFLQANAINYKQFSNEFVPWLSIIDVMMFNRKEEIQNWLRTGYTLQ